MTRPRTLHAAAALALALGAAAIPAIPAAPASASGPGPAALTCHPWRTATWGRGRDCSDGGNDGTITLQWSDWGPADGHCVQLWAWSPDRGAWADTGLPASCSTSISWLGGVYWYGWQIRRTGGGAFLSVCDGVNPDTPAPACYRD